MDDLVLVYVFWIVVGAILGAVVNDSKGRSPGVGAVVLLGLIGVLILAVQSNLKNQPQPAPQLWPCPNCHSHIPSSSQFCPVCGFRLVN
jgi:xanthosine utilization system XapX-like protein